MCACVLICLFFNQLINVDFWNAVFICFCFKLVVGLLVLAYRPTVAILVELFLFSIALSYLKMLYVYYIITAKFHWKLKMKMNKRLLEIPGQLCVKRRSCIWKLTLLLILQKLAPKQQLHNQNQCGLKFEVWLRWSKLGLRTVAVLLNKILVCIFLARSSFLEPPLKS